MKITDKGGDTQGLLQVVAVIFALAMISSAASGETRTWTGAASQDWFNASNWAPAGSPASDDDLRIYTGTPEAWEPVTVSDGGGILISGDGAVLGIADLLYVGHTGAGAFRVEAGGEAWVDYMYLGYLPGSQGIVTVADNGLAWMSYLRVGIQGSGTLNVESGGQVYSSYSYLGSDPGSLGNVTVTGSGSTWTNEGPLYVGQSGAGSLSVAQGGSVATGTLFASLTDLSGDSTITAKGAVLDDEMTFDTAGGTQATLGFGTGGTLTVTADGTGDLGAGYKGTGTLTISGGTTVASKSGFLGYYCGSQGTATVTGSGSKWTNTSDLYVGREGIGQLIVAAGGSVTARALYASLSDLSGDGTIVAKGAVPDGEMVFDAMHGMQPTLGFGTGGRLALKPDGTADMGAGYKGTGTLTIADGMGVASTSGFLGYGPGSQGTAMVMGSGSWWASLGDFHVGREGSGTLTVQDGGHVFCDATSFVGYSMGSQGTVTVRDWRSKWAVHDDLYVGYEGIGTLRIEDGGSVTSSRDGYLGYSPGSQGTVTVMNDSEWVNQNDLYVGHGGTGALSIEYASVALCARSAFLGYSPGSLGTVTVSWDSRWITGRDLELRRGSLTVSINSLVLVGGDYSQGAGTGLLMEFDRLPDNPFGAVLSVDGAVDLAGALEIGLVHGFVPAEGDMFNLLDFSGLSGYFDDIVLPSLPSGLVWDAAQLYVDGSLTVLARHGGDANNNGVVDVGDLGVLAYNWKQNGRGWSTADFTGNGLVDVGDLGVLAANWGWSRAPGSEGPTVPEPATLGLLALGGLVIHRRRTA